MPDEQLLAPNVSQIQDEQSLAPNVSQIQDEQSLASNVSQVFFDDAKSVLIVAVGLVFLWITSIRYGLRTPSLCRIQQ